MKKYPAESSKIDRADALNYKKNPWRIVMNIAIHTTKKSKTVILKDIGLSYHMFQKLTDKEDTKMYPGSAHSILRLCRMAGIHDAVSIFWITREMMPKDFRELFTTYMRVSIPSERRKVIDYRQKMKARMEALAALRGRESSVKIAYEDRDNT